MMESILRRLREHFPATILGLLAVTVAAAVISDWGILWENGGWYALLGQSLAVLTTLTILLLLVVLGLGVVLLPLFLYFALADPHAYEDLSPRAIAGLFRDRLRQVTRRCLSVLYRPANFTWRVLWWIWWSGNRVFRVMLSRKV